MREIKKGGLTAIILATEQACRVLLGCDAGLTSGLRHRTLPGWSMSHADPNLPQETWRSRTV
jgi:hypothetical protein